MRKRSLLNRSLLTGLVTGCGLVPLLAGVGAAADLTVKARPAAIYNWTGCYGGIHFGSLFEQQDWGAFGSDHDTGVVLGGQLGCNYQVSSWVFGVQGDLAWSDAGGSHGDQVFLSLTDEWKTKSLGSMTGRIGYAFDQLLVYGKGGIAWRNNTYTTSNTTTGATFSTASDTSSGWTLGGGFEHNVTNTITMFIEYDFYDFGTKTVGFNVVGGGSIPVDVRDRESVVKVGVNWKPW
jgi:outer membrane immunogenic protein